MQNNIQFKKKKKINIHFQPIAEFYYNERKDYNKTYTSHLLNSLMFFSNVISKTCGLNIIKAIIRLKKKKKRSQCLALDSSFFLSSFLIQILVSHSAWCKFQRNSNDRYICVYVTDTMQMWDRRTFTIILGKLWPVSFIVCTEIIYLFIYFKKVL